MNSLRPWLAAARPDRALIAPLCVGVGSSYAHFDAHRGPGLLAPFLVTIGAFAAALGVNLIDFVWDAAGAPPPDPKAAGPEPPVDVGGKAAVAAGVAAIGLAALCGIALASVSGSAPLGYGAVAVFLGVARLAPAVGFETLGWGLGEVAQVAALGPLAAMAGYASQAGVGSSGAFLAGLPSGLVAAAALVGPRRVRPTLDAETERSIAVALPVLAAAAIAIAARFWDYPAWAGAAAAPMILASVAAWRFPARPHLADIARGERLAIVCAVASLTSIVVALGVLSPE